MTEITIRCFDGTLSTLVAIREEGDSIMACSIERYRSTSSSGLEAYLVGFPKSDVVESRNV